MSAVDERAALHKIGRFRCALCRNVFADSDAGFINDISPPITYCKGCYGIPPDSAPRPARGKPV